MGIWFKFLQGSKNKIKCVYYFIACYQDSQACRLSHRAKPNQGSGTIAYTASAADTPTPHTHKQTYTDTHTDARTYCIYWVNPAKKQLHMRDMFLEQKDEYLCLWLKSPFRSCRGDILEGKL